MVKAQRTSFRSHLGKATSDLGLSTLNDRGLSTVKNSARDLLQTAHTELMANLYLSIVEEMLEVIHLSCRDLLRIGAPSTTSTPNHIVGPH